MSLNIKNPRVHALAREAARVTGKSQTGAIEEALERLLREYGADPTATDQQRRLDAITAVAIEWHSLPATTSADHVNGDRVTEVADLYDTETGLPVR